MFKGQPLCEISRDSLRYILYKVYTEEFPAAERVRHLERICEAYMACQAEQARALDEVYGQLSGRTQTLKDQLLALLNRHKQRTLVRLPPVLKYCM